MSGTTHTNAGDGPRITDGGFAKNVSEVSWYFCQVTVVRQAEISQRENLVREGTGRDRIEKVGVVGGLVAGFEVAFGTCSSTQSSQLT